MAERGVAVVHTTVLRWVQCFVPVFEKMWKNYALPVGPSWRVDETYIKVKGQWRYLHRAVDQQGQTADSLLSKNLDKAPALRFFKKAIGSHEAPEKITLDGSQASHQAVAELKAEGVLPAQTIVRTDKYLKNLIEQDHRKVKQRCYPMLGYKTFWNVEVTLSGIELANKIKKGRFDGFNNLERECIRVKFDALLTLVDNSNRCHHLVIYQLISSKPFLVD
jgi:transposase-like protein